MGKSSKESLTEVLHAVNRIKENLQIDAGTQNIIFESVLGRMDSINNEDFEENGFETLLQFIAEEIEEYLPRMIGG